MSNPPQPPVLYPAQGTKGPVLYLNPYQGTYTRDRAYGLRMQRGHAAGLPQAVARRSGPAGTTPFVPESEVRKQRFLERWGFEERVWRRLWRKYIREINEMASPAGQITKAIVRQVLMNTPSTGLGADWLENRLAEKLEDMKEYRSLERRAHQNPDTSGYDHYFSEADERGMTPIELWWYH